MNARRRGPGGVYDRLASQRAAIKPSAQQLVTHNRIAVRAAGRYKVVDTDAHAPGQLEWQPYGCDRAAARGVPVETIVNSWAVDDLLAWAGRQRE